MVRETRHGGRRGGGESGRKGRDGNANRARLSASAPVPGRHVACDTMLVDR